MIKGILKSTLIVALWAALFALGACKKDELTEDEVLKLMQETSFSFKVQEPYTSLGVPGAKVMLVHDGKTITQETDAHGVAYFEKVKVGSVHVTVQKDQYLTYSNEVNVNASGRNGQRGIKLNLYYLGNDQNLTATIRGRVVIQTDLTTKIPEVPTGLTIRAEFYGFNETVTIPATVDNQGKFSMSLPVGVNEKNVKLTFPTVMYDQTLEVVDENASVAGATKVVTKLATFDPNILAINIPQVGSNIARSNPSLKWPNGNYIHYNWYAINGYNPSSYPYVDYNSYVVRPNSVIDLTIDYGTGSARQ